MKYGYNHHVFIFVFWVESDKTRFHKFHPVHFKKTLTATNARNPVYTWLNMVPPSFSVCHCHLFSINTEADKGGAQYVLRLLYKSMFSTGVSTNRTMKIRVLIYFDSYAERERPAILRIIQGVQTCICCVWHHWMRYCHCCDFCFLGLHTGNYVTYRSVQIIAATLPVVSKTDNL